MLKGRDHPQCLLLAELMQFPHSRQGSDFEERVRLNKDLFGGCSKQSRCAPILDVR